MRGSQARSHFQKAISSHDNAAVPHASDNPQKSHGHLFSGVSARIAYDYATDFIKAERQVGLTFSILALQSMYADKTSRNTAHVGTTAQQPPQHDLLLAHSFCRAVYGLTFPKGRFGNATRNNEVKPFAAC